MKKITLLAALLATQFAGATSIRRDVRLEAAEIQNDGFKRATLVVHSNGLVQKRICEPRKAGGCETNTVAKLSAYEMDRIDRLIDRARRNERQVNVRARIYCFVAPTSFHQFTADNGTLNLKRGHACTGFLENQAPAARRLTVLLTRLNSGATLEGLSLDLE